jgi:O-antigen/teichoic acid export membrane protein
MAEIISTSARMFLKRMHDESNIGLYAAGYDLASHILGVILMIINLAAYPLAVRALEQKGKEAARGQLQKNFVLIVAIALPAAAGLAVLAPGITGLIIGEEFQKVAQMIVPWVALAALLAGLKSYYFDMAFQLGQNTIGQLKILAVAALVNLVLNFILIPDYSVMGAIYATVIAYAVGLILSAIKGRKYFLLPVPGNEIVKITVATGIMSLIILPFYKLAGIIDFLVSVTMGAIVYLFMILILDVAGARTLAKQLFSGVKRAG